MFQILRVRVLLFCLPLMLPAELQDAGHIRALETELEVKTWPAMSATGVSSAGEDAWLPCLCSTWYHTIVLLITSLYACEYVAELAPDLFTTGDVFPVSSALKCSCKLRNIPTADSETK